MLTPLSPPHFNTTSFWRYTLMVPAGDARSDDEPLIEETIRNCYEEIMVGPRPLQVEIFQRAVYCIHQRLVPTMRRGRCVLAGDAAHLNSPYGAVGLNTGLLDADALSEALIMIVAQSRSDKLLTL
ncbi:FAD-binding monooxygenase [Aspergillus keveii]|uniref:FAD-binding monooxygenase n=1 Tax=Aspergillus keveii TaxID=714993 RepID=A0ABR4FZP7_9EURO